MRATVKRTTRFFLELNEHEAAWLREYVRNQMDPEEQTDDAAMRKTLFESLDSVVQSDQFPGVVDDDIPF